MKATRPYDLDDEFEDFMRKCYSHVPEYARQYTESRRVFMAGAASVYYCVVSLGAADIDEDEGTKQLGELGRQLQEFVNQLTNESKSLE